MRRGNPAGQRRLSVAGLDQTLGLGDRRGKRQGSEQFGEANRRLAKRHLPGLDIFGDFLVSKYAIEFFASALRRLRSVVLGDDGLGQVGLGVHGMTLAAFDILLHSLDFFQRYIRRYFVIPPHHEIGNGHHLAKLFAGHFVDADVVSE